MALNPTMDRHATIRDAIALLLSISTLGLAVVLLRMLPNVSPTTVALALLLVVLGDRNDGAPWGRDYRLRRYYALVVTGGTPTNPAAVTFSPAAFSDGNFLSFFDSGLTDGGVHLNSTLFSHAFAKQWIVLLVSCRRPSATQCSARGYPPK